ncbi:MAG: Two-component sensor histidine kinase [Candidatus Daviesbacteria bacterium GW2011_GWA1_41_61]|uniref:histidine kinase n=1 Tax=Candidatus Daviesbacteria bacterium GW2011_GWA2_40_9 TaxID=1618424 RepID=A0A0G0U6D0_9BACT|nr:MAG: PAS/PAC sensor signal transduction histidine kinase [Candidatus Daviesbacteria bacterium GW2011_GWC1_40_9]KKR82751.1 MAG: Two-component sensor histidine kinase [Candidatus Daviesbacteria bacterium GW2011_GWA2_40_9]KKR93783.1 MAG: Two-component sensor histidine kinase [Candidatus Daviesbacteria bacterium GW2011_GWB1_41_15]KKS15249.1 MAG: Two-component sensor histidine kinase [Candidatus Daviesbacteria bacterium GW2011_GWA1_41_61]
MEDKKSKSGDISHLDRLRRSIRLTLLSFLLSSFLWVNLLPLPFANKTLLNIVLTGFSLYFVIYNFFSPRFLRSIPSVYLGATSLALIFAIFIYLTGGNESIFIGYLYLFITVIGLSLGFVSLFFMSLTMEAIFIFFFFSSAAGFSSSPAFAFLVRNTILNLVTFAGGYLIMKEFVLRGRQYAQMEALSREQKLINKEKDEIIAVVSHEFRTPLSAIKGYLDLLVKETIRLLSEEQRGYLKKMQVNAARLQVIIENTLNVSIYESGTMSLFLQPVDFEKLVVDVVNNTLQFEAEDKKIYLKMDLPQIRLPLISADPQRLKDVVINLVENAIKYTEQGGVTVSLLQDGEWVVMVVADTGKGIDPKDLPNLFQKFYRGGDYKNRTIQGAGLGLYITKKLVEKHHGTIEITSELGKGTVVTLKLPTPKEGETWS